MQVFDPSSTQAAVFEEISQLVQSSMDGYNVCVFAYGQTGSGKTFTMLGGDDAESRGMIPRAVEQVGSANVRVSVSISVSVPVSVFVSVSLTFLSFLPPPLSSHLLPLCNCSCLCARASLQAKDGSTPSRRQCLRFTTRSHVTFSPTAPAMQSPSSPGLHPCQTCASLRSTAPRM